MSHCPLCPWLHQLLLYTKYQPLIFHWIWTSESVRTPAKCILHVGNCQVLDVCRPPETSPDRQYSSPSFHPLFTSFHPKESNAYFTHSNPFVFVDLILSHRCIHIMRHTSSTHNAIAALIEFDVVQRLVQCPMLIDDHGKIDRHNPVFADCY